MEYTEEEKYQHYLLMVAAIKLLKTKQEITPQWMETHKTQIIKIRETIPNFNEINEDIENPTFRKNLQDADTILSYMIKTIKTSGTFDTRMYLIFNQKVLATLEELFSEKELEEMLNSLSI
jgi:hypothetical protein